MKRTFLAIKLQPTEDLKRMMSYLQKNLEYERRNISWGRLDQMHLTLKFIGDTPDEDIQKISDAMQTLSQRHKPFVMRFDRTGLFGSNRSPRVMWLGMKDEPQALYDLANDVLDTFDGIGYPRDRQNFVPHVTLCRIKRLIDKDFFLQLYDAIEQKPYIDIKVNEFSFLQSFLNPDGARYKTLRRFELRE